MKNLLRLQWATTKGVEDIEVLRLLTEDLQRDLRSKLCDNLLTAVRACLPGFHRPTHSRDTLLPGSARHATGGTPEASLALGSMPGKAHQAQERHTMACAYDGVYEMAARLGYACGRSMQGSKRLPLHLVDGYLT